MPQTKLNGVFTFSEGRFLFEVIFSTLSPKIDPNIGTYLIYFFLYSVTLSGFDKYQIILRIKSEENQLCNIVSSNSRILFTVGPRFRK